MGVIKKIPDHLINQIAAGEVIERPSSCIKELIENSLDAGAKKIEIHLTNGGIEEIKIIDDGFGISKNDLALCCKRHTTSKLAQFEDLFNLNTFGFRGEALSSIASVSELSIISKTKDEDCGYKIEYNNGKQVGEITPCASPIGTTVCIHNIFSQIPARQKFLRSSQTEFSNCHKIIKEIALGTPNISYYLFHNQRLVVEYVSQNEKQRILSCLKPVHDYWSLEESNDIFAMKAYLSPTHLLSEQGEIYLFINNRCIKNKMLNSAIRNSYRDTLGPHHEPSGVFFIEIKKEFVDVNVHPQKQEIRIHRQESIYPWVLNTIKKAISQQKTVLEYSPPKIEYEPLKDSALPTPSHIPSFIREPEFRTQIPLVEFTKTPELKYKYLGQIFASFLICEDTTGLLLVDQHALHEKQKFEELKKLYENKKSSQHLLISKILHLTPDKVAMIIQNKEIIESLGFELEEYSGSLALKAIPDILSDSNLEEMFVQFCLDLQTCETLQPTQVLRPLLATMACHSVVKANEILSLDKVRPLLSYLETIEEGWTCPHGRPILFRMSLENIKKQFKRI